MRLSRKLGWTLIVLLGIATVLVWSANGLKSCDRWLTPTPPAVVYLTPLYPQATLTPSATLYPTKTPKPAARVIQRPPTGQRPSGGAAVSGWLDDLKERGKSRNLQVYAPLFLLLLVILWGAESRQWEESHWMVSYWLPVANTIFFMLVPLWQAREKLWVFGPMASPWAFRPVTLGCLILGVAVMAVLYFFRRPDKTSLALTIGLVAMLSTIPVVSNRVGIGAFGLAFNLPKAGGLSLIPALEALGQGSDLARVGARSLLTIGMAGVAWLILGSEMQQTPWIAGVVIAAKIALFAIRAIWAPGLYYITAFMTLGIMALASFGRNEWGQANARTMQIGRVQITRPTDLLIWWFFGLWFFGLIVGTI